MSDLSVSCQEQVDNTGIISNARESLLQGNPLRSMAICQQLIRSQPSFSEAYVIFGDSLNKLGRWKEAVRSYTQATTIDPQFVQAYIKIGDICYQRGQWYQAIQSYRCAVALRPDLRGIRARLLEIEQVCDELRIQIDKASSNFIPVLSKANYYLYEGNKSAFQGYLDDAIRQYEQAIFFDSSVAELHFNLATALYHLGKATRQARILDKSIYHFQKAVDLKPEWADAYFQLGNALEVRSGLNIEGLNKAIVCWKRAIVLQPNLIEAYEKAVMYLGYYQTNFQEALAIKEKLVYQRKLLNQDNPLSNYKIRFLSDYCVRHIGHFMTLDIVIKMGVLGLRPPYFCILLAPPEIVVNASLLDYWKQYTQYIHIVSEPSLIQYLRPLARELQPLGLACEEAGSILPIAPIIECRFQEVQNQWDAEGREPLLTLTLTDRERGLDCLKQFGIARGDWFVALHVREGGYYREGEGSWSSCRNANIDTYKLAIDHITSLGGWVIRMGDPTMKPLPQMPQVIDYAHSDIRSDWMDVFLWAKCRFFICTGSGPVHIPPSFGIPRLITNFSMLPSLPFAVSNCDLSIPKLYWSLQENRYLSFSEMFSPPIKHTMHCKHLQIMGIQVIDNSPEDIRDAVNEMLDALDDRDLHTEEAQGCVERMNEIMIRGCGFSCRISHSFLVKHRDLLRIDWLS